MTLQQWADKTERNLDIVSRELKLEILKNLVMGTRIDTGRMRGNWQLSQDSPITSELDRLDKDGGPTIEAEGAKVTGVSLTYITNNLPYVEVWNERDAIVAKMQAAVGRMVKTSVKKVER